MLRRQRDTLDSWGVRIVWIGREQRLWGSVIRELKEAEERTRENTRMTLYMCVNYGGRAELVDAVREIAEEARAGRLKGSGISERTIQRHLIDPHMPEVDLFLRTSGEQRTSNFLLWQSAYAELVFVEELWPDVDRRVLWRAITGTRADAATAQSTPGSALDGLILRPGGRRDRAVDGRPSHLSRQGSGGDHAAGAAAVPQQDRSAPRPRARPPRPGGTVSTGAEGPNPTVA